MMIEEALSQQDAEAIAALAQEIWTQHYVPIIGQAQVDYMLKTIQSPAAIARQIQAGYRYFLIIAGPAGYVGYFAVVPDPVNKAMLLSKFYLKLMFRRKGLGADALAFIEGMCRREGFHKLWLTVNKRNPTVDTYESMGFRKTGALVQDIGGGFVMDDYRMEKIIAPQPFSGSA